MNTKVCSTCKKEKSITEFYSNGYQSNGNKKYKGKCKKCQEDFDRENFLQKVESILIDLGTSYRCEMCGYDKNTAALCFHHIEPHEKEFSLNSCKTYSIEKLRKEIEKCVVLCHNCHMEEHYPHLNKR